MILLLDSFVMAKTIALEVRMKIVTTVQQQLNHRPVSSYARMARAFQRQESVITSRTATTVWMKLTAHVPTPHNGAVQELINVSLLVTSAMERKNVPKEKMRRTVLQYYQQQLLQLCLAFPPQHNQLQVSPPPRLPQLR